MAAVRPAYIYVASSWRNTLQPGLMHVLAAAGLDAYDFRNPEAGTDFSWKQVSKDYDAEFSVAGPQDEYLRMLQHPIAQAGFRSDFEAMQRADTFVLVLPCGRSAHLELGWAVGAGKRTAILLDDPCTPELMYLMVDKLATSVIDLLDWLGIDDS